MARDTPGNAATLAQAAAEWLRGQMETAGAERLVLGLSGGIDSAVVCGLCTMAAGPERVIAAIMPIYSLPADVDDATAVAQRFGVKPRFFSLVAAYSALVSALGLSEFDAASNVPAPDPARRALALANIKPRLRMTTLYALANDNNGIVVGTGNKSELSIGYFTKYGDGGVDLLPLGDLDKTAVRALARELEVPASVIARPPSAGLWEGQTDEGEIGLAYDELDRALQAIAANESDELAAEARSRVKALMRASEHKRQPAPIFRYD